MHASLDNRAQSKLGLHIGRDTTVSTPQAGPSKCLRHATWPHPTRNRLGSPGLSCGAVHWQVGPGAGAAVLDGGLVPRPRCLHVHTVGGKKVESQLAATQMVYGVMWGR
jgi:hypothetical protein